MLDGLALAETTPGPLILVLEFVGFVAAYKTGGIALALAGAVMTLWTTFVPALSPIFIGAPYIEALRGRRVLDGALAAITAAVVGVIANLSLFLAMHALFGVVDERNIGIVHVGVPDVTTLDVWMLGLTALAFALLFGAKQGLARTLAVCGVLGAIVTLLRR
jgi:chromate transporter